MMQWKRLLCLFGRHEPSKYCFCGTFEKYDRHGNEVWVYRRICDRCGKELDIAYTKKERN